MTDTTTATNDSPSAERNRAMIDALRAAAERLEGYTRRILNDETEDFDIHFAEDEIAEMIAEIEQKGRS